MCLRKHQLAIFITGIIMLACYTIYYILSKNYEFLLYVGVLIFIAAIIMATNKKVKYSNISLWGLLMWAFLHMAGGSFVIDGTRLYDIMLIPLIKSYSILKFDQFVHMFGFGVTTFVMYDIIKLVIKPKLKKWTAVSILIVMAATGAGALNEIVEFITTIYNPNGGVGGYVNNSLDLIFNLIGALIALLIIQIVEKRKKR